MADVLVHILKITDDSFPVFVECALVDRTGKIHYFRDKLPVFSSEHGAAVPGIGKIKMSYPSGAARHRNHRHVARRSRIHRRRAPL